jgi:mannose-6-phosphate isomerase class I
VACDKFLIDRRTLDAPLSLGGDDRLRILLPVEGAARVEGDAAEEPLARGQTLLLPAAAGAVRITPLGKAVIVEVTLP